MLHITPMLTPSPPFLPQSYLFTFPFPSLLYPSSLTPPFNISLPCLLLARSHRSPQRICFPCLMGIIYLLSFQMIKFLINLLTLGRIFFTDCLKVNLLIEVCIYGHLEATLHSRWSVGISLISTWNFGASLVNQFITCSLILSIWVKGNICSGK